MRNGMLRSASFIHYRAKLCKYSSIVSWVFIGIVVCLAATPLKSQVLANKILTPQVPSTPGQAASSPTPSPTPTPVRAVPLHQIAEQAEELESQLRKTQKALIQVPDRQVEDLGAKAQEEEISRRAHQLEDLLTGIPNRMQLQQE